MSTNNNRKEIARGFNAMKEAAGSFVKWKMKKSMSKMKKWTLKWRLQRKGLKKKKGMPAEISKDKKISVAEQAFKVTVHNQTSDGCGNKRYPQEI